MSKAGKNFEDVQGQHMAHLARLDGQQVGSPGPWNMRMRQLHDRASMQGDAGLHR